MERKKLRLIDKIRSSRLYPLLISLPYAPYRGSVLRFIRKDIKSVLEVGCGKGNLISSLYFPKTVPKKVGLDIFAPDVEICKSKNLYDYCIRGEASSLPFSDNAFDCIVCVEVIEHLSKEKGIELIYELERVAQKQIIVSTTDLPLQNFDPKKAPGGNIFMYHRSRWMPFEFQNMGYTVRGMYPRFTKCSKYDPVYFMSYLLPLMYLVYYFPNQAKAFVATKNLNRR